MVVISRATCERMLRLLHRSEGYCRNARSSYEVDLQAEPTETYPGASGYAGATMREIICTIESHL